MRAECEAHIQKEVSQEYSKAFVITLLFSLLHLQAERWNSHVVSQALLEERLEHLRAANEAHVQSQVSEEIRS